MKKEDFKKQYRDLEMRVYSSLRDAVNNSEYVSKLFGVKALKVNLFDYTELAIVDDHLTFVDSRGLLYSFFSEASLEDLIDILNENQEKKS